MRRFRPHWLLPVLLVLPLLPQLSSRPQPAQASEAPASLALQAGEPTDRAPERYQGSFLDLTAEAMLRRLGVTVYPEDKVFAFPDPALGIGSELRVYRAQPVLIQDGAVQRLVRTWAPTVAALADEQRLELAAKDIVQPDRTAVIPVQDQAVAVTITRVAEAEVAVREPVDYRTRYVDDPELERGQTVEEQRGKEGTLVRTFLVRRENGIEVSRREIKRELTVEPVEAVIRRGTKVVQYGSGGASWYAAPSMTAAHRTLPMGTLVRVVNLSNGKSVTVRIADRGPYIAGRVIDLSSDAFAQIAPLGAGTADVRLEKE